MVNKNLRSVLFYVVGVSFVCLMVEFRKRSQADFYSLNKDKYAVVTANQAELVTTPNTPSGEESREEIPLRNRGRTPTAKDKGDGKSKNSTEGKGEKEKEGKESVDLKRKYREWKKEHGSAGKKEKGMFKKWKEQMGLNKEESEADEDKKFKEWKNQLPASRRKEKGLFKKWKKEDEFSKKREHLAVDILEDNRENINEEDMNGKEQLGEVSRPGEQTKQEEELEEQGGLRELQGEGQKKDLDAGDFQTWKKKNNVQGEVKGLFKKWKAEKNQKKLAELMEEDPEAENEELAAEKIEPVSVYSPPEPEHSCTNFKFTEEQLKRAADVRDQCAKLSQEVSDQSRMLSRLRWAVPERLLYCPVFKAASTTWLVNLLKLSNSTIDPKVGNLHTRITNLFPVPASFKLRKKIYAESLKFLIVRHPFERLVSAYRDKLAGYSRNPHYLNMRKLIINKYRVNTSDDSSIPSFRESVEFVMDELTAMEEGSSTINIDGHFMPYTRRCLPCGMEYDLIIKFENLEDDSNYIIQQCGLQHKLSVTHENPSPTGPKTEQGYKNKSKKAKKENLSPPTNSAEVSLQFFKDIPVDQIMKLYEHYKLDFKIFGYSVDEYLKKSPDEIKFVQT